MSTPEEFIFEYFSPKGCEYKIGFSTFPKEDFERDIEIFDLVLKQITNSRDDAHLVLSYLVRKTLQFIEKHNCIIYLYCDKAPIPKANRNKDLSNQEFRSRLFNSLFETARRRAIREFGTFNFIIRNIEIPDPIYGDHFIALIAHASNLTKIEQLEMSIVTLNEKD